MRRLIIYIILAIIVMLFTSRVTAILHENLNAKDQSKNPTENISQINENKIVVKNCPNFDFEKLGVINSTSLSVQENEIKIEIVCTNQSREKGLSGREHLASSTGMFFIFERPAVQNFWMKEMNFPIDIVWIDSNFRVVGIIYDAKPESYPNIFASPEPVKYVLELNSGEAEKFSLKKGLALVPLK